MSILLQLLSVSIFKFSKCLSIFFLSLKKIIIPLLIEFLILLDMCSLTFLSLLCLIEDKFIMSSFIILLFKFSNSIQGHFSFNIFPFHLTGLSMLFKNFNKVLDVFTAWLLLQCSFYVLSGLHLKNLFNKNII